MAVKRKAKPRRKSKGAFTFQLGWTGLAGVTVVAFCLFLWMFILGVWAGQTILLPKAKGKKIVSSKQRSESSINLHRLQTTIQPETKKRPVN